jgi:hypothetical protein
VIARAGDDLHRTVDTAARFAARDCDRRPSRVFPDVSARDDVRIPSSERAREEVLLHRDRTPTTRDHASAFKREKCARES